MRVSQQPGSPTIRMSAERGMTTATPMGVVPPMILTTLMQGITHHHQVQEPMEVAIIHHPLAMATVIRLHIIHRQIIHTQAGFGWAIVMFRTRFKSCLP